MTTQQAALECLQDIQFALRLIVSQINKDSKIRRELGRMYRRRETRKELLRRVLKLRDRGASYRIIAERFNITKGYAGVLIGDAIQERLAGRL